MTLEAVANEAGVTRPTIYRRWPTKADLAVAAIQDLVVRKPPTCGDTETDLTAILRSVRQGWVDEGIVALLGGMFPEHHHNPTFIDLLRERAIEVRRQQIEDVLRSGQTSGELLHNLDVPVIIDLLLGSFLSRHMAGEAIPFDWPFGVVTVVVRSIRK